MRLTCSSTSLCSITRLDVCHTRANNKKNGMPLLARLEHTGSCA